MVRKILLLVILLLPITLFCQEKNGSIRGKAYSNEGPLIGVNVVIVNTTLGTSTDVNGNYEIKDLLFGSYIIRASYIGLPRQTDTVELTEEKPDIVNDFPYMEIYIPLSDSIKRYRDLFAAMKPDEILKITIDSTRKYLSNSLANIYCTFTNISKYPVYIIEDLNYFQTVFPVVKDHTGKNIRSSFILSDVPLGFVPGKENLIKINPSESVHLKTNFLGDGVDFSSQWIPKGKYFISVKYKCDYDHIPGLLISPKQFDINKYQDLINTFALPIRGTFYSENYLEVEK